MEKSDCLFCKIAQGVVPSDTVFEDEAIKAFRDIRPSAPIHILVIPKEHIESVANLEENHADLVARLVYAAKNIASTMGLVGYKLVFNVGRDGGQVIDHLHLHLLAGWEKGKVDNSAPLHV
ncbi:MAG: histidine triad nucleotide-binding protein [Candidatus Sungbacteria bacterium RIFCSPLOWO2_02_FULL_48_13b]|uniref:Histidine triad nucleotide-binding protein n=2 Tax=Candidatus Sungiibacteriota TaxID=1817917 RepID=A0A1G2LGT9_9BACT|nr:MAG: histidine triad nucleotide-binding protein [Candidatus Sungbacteria bacterium RIFCSPHIGHO2_02_FULL_49_20]OHA10032.1 MAG: histidine triad nucleotide-binding protein [Candidatus Sungbacteria bacterium RIFCSPLOWO2_02_FULL_48_13b]